MTVVGRSDPSCSLLFNSSINNCTSSETYLTSSLYPWYIVAGVIIVVSCLFGIPANITVIVKLGRHLHGSSMSQRLFFNLAMSDLLCLLCLPVGMVIFFSGLRLTHGACQLLIFFFFFCMTSDLNNLVLISIQRYCQVLHPNRWARLSRIGQCLLLFTVWMLGALLALPAVFLLIEVETEDELTSPHSCKNQRIMPMLEAFYISFLVLCHLIVFSFYLLLVRGVKKQQMPGKKQPRVTKLFIRIIAVFLVVGFFPVILRVVHVAALFTASKKLLHFSKMMTFVECFYFFNHCLNPFLYFFASRRYRGESDTKGNILMPLNDNL